MSTVLERLWKQTLDTFSSNNLTSQTFEANFRKVKALADQVKASDLKFNYKLLDSGPKRAPVTYIEIFEDSYVTVGIFVLRSGCKLPLHDHPGMHGILKVISGKISVQSYTVKGIEPSSAVSLSPGNFLPVKPQAIIVEKHQVVTVSENDSACVLTPLERNLHEISADGPAAFLDILSPPYAPAILSRSERDCHYFKELTSSSGSQVPGSITRLVEINCPSSFWCDNDKYAGPPLGSRN